MLKNYCKIAWRNLVKNKVSSFINISGLSVGMAIAILISLWIWNELSFNTYHENHKRIAKIRQNVSVNGNVQTEKTVPLPLAKELHEQYGSYFKYIVMSSHRLTHTLSIEDKNFSRQGVFLEPDGPEMLTLRMVKGTREGLIDPRSILMSRSLAEVIFGNGDPIGHIVKIDNRLYVKVTGVYEDLPANSTFYGLAFIAPFELYLYSEKWITAANDQWDKNPVQAYVQITDNADMDKVSAMIKDTRLSNVSAENSKYNPQLFLEPMNEWHLYSVYNNGVSAGGKIQYVWMFGLIGLFVLLLACINFMNLSTARSQKRSMEVGIRKAIGSLKSQLIKQFFTESVLTVFFSFCFSLLLVQLTLPFFNQLFRTDISMPWSNSSFWLLAIVFILITGVIAGSYPAFYLSSFEPVKVLKGSLRSGLFSATPRKILVTLQFTVSFVLITCTLIVFRQVQFAKDRPIGYNVDGLLILQVFGNNIPDHFDAIKNDLMKAGVIRNMALSEGTVTDVWGTDNDLSWNGKDPDLKVEFPNTGVSVDYGKTVGWQFKEGRDFSEQFPSDSSAFILNEAAVKFMGLKNPVGEIIRWENKPFKIVGVIKDVIVESPYEPIRPSVYCMARWHNNFVVIKLNPMISTQSALTIIGENIKKYAPAQPFDYKFIDEEYAGKFNNEQRAGSLARLLTALAIFISCLGLFGMTSFMVEQRTKEIGIRKILGASVLSLWHMLSKEFLFPVFISSFIAIPPAYYFMYSWLQNYQYRTELAWWIFIASGGFVFFIAFITVSFQAIKAAIANPVQSLRTE